MTTESDATQESTLDDAAVLPTRPDGSVAGYRAQHTLPVWVELWRQIRRRRTWITIGLLAVLPWLMLLAFELGQPGTSGSTGAADTATSSGLNFTMFALFASSNLLLLMIVALFFGDTVASEASWSSLKAMLTVPVSRGRLLRQKMFVSAMLTGVAMAAFFGMSLVTGLLWYGPEELLTADGETMAFPLGLVVLTGSLAYLAIHLMWVAGLAMWLSVRTSSPLAAVGGTVLIAIISQTLDGISALGSLRDFLPTHYSMAWTGLLSNEVDWTEPTYGVFSALTYATVFGLLAARHFARADITS